MRRLLWIFTSLALIWCIWWGVASAVLRGSVQTWLEARQAEGWQAEAQIDGGGFPSTLVAQLKSLALADPATGVALEADTLRLEADAWWPGRARVHLPASPMRLAAPDGRAELLMDQGLMTLQLAPSAALTLRDLSWTSGPWGISQPAGSLVSADALILAMQQTEAPKTYTFDINAQTLAPGTRLREALRVPTDWPLAFESFRADMTVTFDRPWDLRALEDRRPQPRQVVLSLAEAAWGTLRLNLAADLEVDAEGIPTGEIRIQARNWRTMLDLAQTAGLLPPQLRPQAESVLSSLAGATGNPNTIDVTLTARGGFLALGFIPLAPAPRLILR